jgi:hypothetical protein
MLCGEEEPTGRRTGVRGSAHEVGGGAHVTLNHP